MYCPKCGTKNDDNNKFCTNCGNTLQGIAASDDDAVMRERGGGDTFVHRFKYRNGVWRLIDNSTNGTRINGKYFRNGSRILQDGDKITIADVLELEFTRTTNHAKMRRLNNLADEETYLFITEAITLGSDQSNAMVIDDTSDFHATIFHEDGEFWVKDFGSETGTFVNGDKLRPNEICPLAEDMKIEVGKAVIKT